MKYKIVILLTLVVMLTGCNGKTVKTLTCTYENTNEGTEYKTEVIAEVNEKDIIKNATSTMKFEHKEMADEMCANFGVVSDAKNVTCEGTKITIKKFHEAIKSSGDLTKDEFLEFMDNHDYLCK